MDIKFILGPVMGFILRSLLNFNLAHKAVRYLSWSIFLNDQPDLRGKWNQFWEAESKNFVSDESRYGNAEMWQIGKYCYSEFYSSKKKYILFGDLRKSYLVGQWYDATDKMGYLGAFELEIVNLEQLFGVWLGHSKEKHEVKTGQWIWKKR